MTGKRHAAMGDIAFGVIASVGVGALMVDAADMGARAKMFPAAVLWCLLLAALATLCAGILNFRRHGEASSSAASGYRYMQLVVPSLVMIAGGVALVAFGFYVTAPVLIFVMHTLHTRLSTGAVPTPRTLAAGAALAVIATAVMYLIFAVLIGLPAPSGSFF